MIEATIIIAAWQAEGTLEASVSSALSQRDVRLEVIVVDDSSRDNTLAVARKLSEADPRVRALGLARNGGPGAARNAALEIARGDWLAVLDADDAMLPDRLARMIDFARRKKADIVCDDLLLVRDDTSPRLPFLGPSFAATPAQWSLRDYLLGNQARPGRSSLGFLKPVFRRQYLDAHGLRYNKNLRNGEDFHLVLSALVEGAELWFLPEAGYLYSTRTGSISSRLDPCHARSLSDADAAFLEKWGDQLEPSVCNLMQQRIRRIADFAAAEEIMQSLKANRPLHAARALIDRPRAAGRLFRQFSEAIRKRLDP